MTIPRYRKKEKKTAESHRRLFFKVINMLKLMFLNAIMCIFTSNMLVG